MERRKQSLVNMGDAVRMDDGRIPASKNFIANLERAEVSRPAAAALTGWCRPEGLAKQVRQKCLAARKALYAAPPPTIRVLCQSMTSSASVGSMRAGSVGKSSIAITTLLSPVPVSFSGRVSNALRGRLARRIRHCAHRGFGPRLSRSRRCGDVVQASAFRRRADRLAAKSPSFMLASKAR